MVFFFEHDSQIVKKNKGNLGEPPTLSLGKIVGDGSGNIVMTLTFF